MTQKDVFGDRQFIEQDGFLMDRRDTRAFSGDCGGGKRIGWPSNANCATIRLVDACQDFDDC